MTLSLVFIIFKIINKCNSVIYFQIKLSELFTKLYKTLILYRQVVLSYVLTKNNIIRIFSYFNIIGTESLSIVLLTACFMGMLLSFQIAKELISIKAIYLIGYMITTTLVREIAPVLTAVILAGRIGAAFTAELATMMITEQISVLYTLNIDPIVYVVGPRIYACICILPILNMFSILTSIFSSIFLTYILYDVQPNIFVDSVEISFVSKDLIYSCIKSIVFGLVIALISCSWGLSTTGGSKEVGKSTTSAVVTILLLIFSLDFCLSYYMFSSSINIINF